MIAALVLAAGRSQRMGRPKLTLPWKDTTVIGQVLATLRVAGVTRIVVVTGASAEAVRDALAPDGAPGPEVEYAHNTGYAQSEMLASIQCGLAALGNQAEAALIALGDQPQLRADTVRAVLDAYRAGQPGLVVPSHANRRGHPWLVDRALWPLLLSLSPLATPRDFLRAHAGQIRYVESADDSILRDLDTPQDYERERGG